jgi:hypothetical protein
MDWEIAVLFIGVLLLMLVPILWDIRNQGDSTTLWTAVVGIATVALVAATIYNAYILNITDYTLRETLEASNRAWLAVSSVELSLPIDHPDGPVATVHYRDIGKDPALNVRTGIGLLPFRLAKPVAPMREFPDAPWAVLEAQAITACKSVVPSQNEGPSVFPSTSHEKNANTGITLPQWDRERLLKGQDILVVNTCLSYRTWNKVRHTSHCEYLHPALGKPVGEWQFRSCPVGDYAE